MDDASSREAPDPQSRALRAYHVSVKRQKIQVHEIIGSHVACTAAAAAAADVEFDDVIHYPIGLEFPPMLPRVVAT